MYGIYDKLCWWCNLYTIWWVRLVFVMFVTLWLSVCEWQKITFTLDIPFDQLENEIETVSNDTRIDVLVKMLPPCLTVSQTHLVYIMFIMYINYIHYDEMLYIYIVWNKKKKKKTKLPYRAKVLHSSVCSLCFDRSAVYSREAWSISSEVSWQREKGRYLTQTYDKSPYTKVHQPFYHIFAWYFGWWAEWDYECFVHMDGSIIVLGVDPLPTAQDYEKKNYTCTACWKSFYTLWILISFIFEFMYFELWCFARFVAFCIVMFC